MAAPKAMALRGFQIDDDDFLKEALEKRKAKAEKEKKTVLSSESFGTSEDECSNLSDGHLS